MVATMDNERIAYNLLRQNGFNPVAAAGIMGNFNSESSFNPRILQGGGESDDVPVDGQTGYGYAQWTSADRQQGLKDFAAQLGTKASNPDTQIKYMIKEMGPDYIKQLNSMSNAGDVARNFHDNFERSADTEEMLANRSASANALFEKYKHVLPYQTYDNNGQPSGTVSTSYLTDNPNEPLDVQGMMNAVNRPMVNTSAKMQDALQREVGYQAGLMAMGSHVFDKAKGISDMLAKASMANAKEEADIENRQSKLTGVGKLAQMIANSNNASNSKMYAALGQSLGFQLNPMTDRYVTQQQMALQQMQDNRKQNEMNQQMQMKKNLIDYQKNAEIQKAKELAALRPTPTSQPSGGSDGGGRRSNLTAQQLINANKDIINIRNDYSKEYNDTASKVNLGYLPISALRDVTNEYAAKLDVYSGAGIQEADKLALDMANNIAYNEQKYAQDYGGNGEKAYNSNKIWGYGGWK